MSILPVSQLCSDDLARLGNNVARPRRPRLPRALRSDTPSQHRRRQLASVLLSFGRTGPVLVRNRD